MIAKCDARMGFSQSQVIELTVVAHLHDVFGPSDAKVIWREAREGVESRSTNTRVDMVIDTAHRQVTLVRTDRELANAVRSTRLVRVLPLAELIRNAVAAFHRLTQE